MNLNKVITVFIGIFIFTTGNTMASKNEDPSWTLVIQAASVISNNSKNVVALLESARKDNNIKTDDSVFNKEALKNFEKNDTYYDFIEEDTDLEDIPFSVFKTTMIGYGYMSYIDWKDLSSSENMTWVLNELFKEVKLKNLNKTEIKKIDNSVNSILTEPYSIEKQILATNSMIKTIGEVVANRNFRVLWYVENSDSYSFFIVKPEVYQKLNNTKIGYDREFKEPKFSLKDLE